MSSRPLILLRWRPLLAATARQNAAASRQGHVTSLVAGDRQNNSTHLTESKRTFSMTPSRISPQTPPNTSSGGGSSEVGGTPNKEEQHRDAEKEPLPEWPDGVNPRTGERGGPRGPEPTRYGDWERKGRVSDF